MPENLIPRLTTLASTILALTCLSAPLLAEVDSATFGGLRARSIGPAVMGGRISAIDAVASDPLTIYVGAASGGVWKSADAGDSFKPIFDDHPLSIGAIRVDPSNPEVVWVGTGESWVRNSVSVGFGVYKTTDGGDNWRLMGLEDSERIGTIRIDPSDGDTVYVCATGHLWNANEERGVFKTTDGGETWEKVLYVDQETGCADLDVDPQDPRIVYAAMWQFRRSPDFFNSGGPGSGLYKSTDGGKNWTRLEEGLPAGELGRIAVAVAPSRPSVVYATVEAREDGGLYRSDNVGKTWQKVNGSSAMTIRPFYFSELVIDPTDHLRVYKPSFLLSTSSDGGKSFNALLSGGFSLTVHPDHHAVWVNPNNPHEVLLGTDGGLYVSQDRANNWRHVQALPISQFYHVSHDGEWPYNVVGGLQDNFSWRGPSRKNGGILNKHWDAVGTGDGFWTFADPEDSNVIYSEAQGGVLMRMDFALGEFQTIRPYPAAGQPDLRFNWNTPIHISPNDPKTLYFGSQFLHRSRDRGRSWETLSGDLTTNDPRKQRQKESGGLTIDNTTAENHCTIYGISESPENGQVIWAGTDDGQLHVTRDGGETWANVVGNVPGLPEFTWVSSVNAGAYDEATVFATFDGHRAGDMATYVYRTDDFGATWTSLATEEVEGYAWVIKQDPVLPELLYLGTEQGLFLSLDGGGEWARFTENLPRVAVHDIVIHPSEHDVILATHGRGIYVIDDVTPLRALTQDVLQADVAMLPSRPTPMSGAGLFFSFNSDSYAGETLPDAATINYYLKKRHLFGDFRIEVIDHSGEVIKTLSGSKRRGLNRVYWPMRLDPPRLPPATNMVFVFQGPKVLEDTYKVRIVKGKTTVEGEVKLVGDPRSPHSAEDRRFQQKTALELYDRLADLSYLSATLTDLRDQGRKRVEGLGKNDAKRLRTFADRAEEMRTQLVSTGDTGLFGGDEKLREHLAVLFGEVVGYDGRPTQSQLTRTAILSSDLEVASRAVEGFLGEDLVAANALLEKRGAEPMVVKPREQWDEENASSGSTSSALTTRVSAGWLPLVFSALAM